MIYVWVQEWYVWVENTSDVGTLSIGLCSAKCQIVLSRCVKSTTQTFRHRRTWHVLSAQDFRILHVY